MTNNPYSKIKQTSIMTASPQELTMMLYDGAVKFANQAIVAIDQNDLPKAHELIIRCQDIILELQSSLDMKYPVAQSLEPIYEYVLTRLIDANVQKSSEILDETLYFLRELRDTWKQAMELAKNQVQARAL